MKTVSLRAGDLLHVETPNGIVNIRAGLRDMRGRAVDSIATTPDNYAGEPRVMRFGTPNVRLVRCKGGRK